MSTPLARAILLIKRDQAIPVDLYVQLTTEGHNVEALIRKHALKSPL
jgi:hypothetical protein